MRDFSRLDRRSLLQALTLAGAGLGSKGLIAAPRGVDPTLRRGYCSTAFGQVHYWALGQGPAVVMVHQSAQSSAEYAAVAPYLSDRFRVIAIDLPGHGQSDTADHELDCDEYADAVIAVLDEEGITTAHIGGHHGGAMVAFNAALRYPDRVDRLFMSGAARGDDFDLEAALAAPMSRDLPWDEQGDFLLKTWNIYREMSAPGIPPEVTFEPFLVSLQNRLRRYDMHYAVYRWDWPPLIAGFSKPTLLLHGEQDIFAGDVLQLHNSLQNSTYKKVPGGAWQFYEFPAENAQAIAEFLG